MSNMVEFENLLEVFESHINTDEFLQLQKDLWTFSDELIERA